jgi:1,4-dihydroxy-2-naphthoate octaprenyltransferase
MMQSKLRTWIRASRPAANTNLTVPLIFGQALALGAKGKFDWTVFALILFYGWFAEMYIVFWNDWADHKADLLNRYYTIFSGGSRVLPDGALSPRSLWLAGWANLVLLLVSAAIFWHLGRIYMPALALVGAALLWLYSMPPVQLNYRGGGEVLQGLGCGIVLPLTGYYAQAVEWEGMRWELLFPLFAFYFISSIATSLPDQQADSLARKNTLAAVFGMKKAASLAVLIGLVGVSFTALTAGAPSAAIFWLAYIAPAALLILCGTLIPQLEIGSKYMTLFIASIILVTISYPLGFSLTYFCGW